MNKLKLAGWTDQYLSYVKRQQAAHRRKDDFANGSGSSNEAIRRARRNLYNLPQQGSVKAEKAITEALNTLYTFYKKGE